MNVPGSLTVHTVFILVLFALTAGIAGAVSVPDVTDIVPKSAVNTSDRVSINITGSDFTNGVHVLLVPCTASPLHKGSITDGAGSVPFLNGPQAVFLSGTEAYIASQWSNALEIVDVSNPAVPIHLGAMINGAGGALLESPSAVYVAGPYAYVTGSTGNSLEIADTGSVCSVPAESVSVLSGSSLNAVFNLTAATAGEYSIVVTNPGGTPGRFAGNFTVTAPLPPPQVIGISPYEGFNTTVVRVTNLEGSSFNTTVAPVVKLNRTGFADIVATNVTVLRSTQLACTLDLSGRKTGSRNVVVVNPDGQESLLIAGFTILPDPPTAAPTTVPTHSPSPVLHQGSATTSAGSGSSGSGLSAVATSPGAPAGGTLSFVFDSTRNTGYTGLPYAVTEVSLVPSRALGQTDLIVSDARLAARSPGDGRVTAGIVAVKTVATNPSSISSVTITFAVADDWLQENALTPDRVVLMHQEGGIWSELPTTYLHRSKDSHFFAATTRRLSFFAISTRSTGEPATVTADLDNDNAPTEASVPDSSFGSLPAYTDDPGAHPFAEHPVKTLAPVGYESKKIPRSSGGAMHWAVIPAFVIGTVMCGMCVRRWWLRRQNPALFRKYD
jgi:LVIVD repeat.